MKEDRESKAREINQRARAAMEDSAYVWFWGYCKPMHEWMAHRELDDREFLAYFPFEAAKQRIPGRRNAPKDRREQTVYRAAISGTVIFGMDRAAPRWLELRSPQIFTTLVINPSTGRPAPVSGREMLAFVDRNSERFNRREALKEVFRVGETVKADAATAIESEIKAINGQKATVEMELFGAKRDIEIPLSKLVKMGA